MSDYISGRAGAEGHFQSRFAGDYKDHAIDALRVERDQLRTELDEAKQGQRVLAHELEAARAEIERLKVANAALERL